jgi:hypothetical protein
VGAGLVDAGGINCVCAGIRQSRGGTNVHGIEEKWENTVVELSRECGLTSIVPYNFCTG